jgi:hypothetical protein
MAVAGGVDARGTAGGSSGIVNQTAHSPHRSSACSSMNSGLEQQAVRSSRQVSFPGTWYSSGPGLSAMTKTRPAAGAEVRPIHRAERTDAQAGGHGRFRWGDPFSGSLSGKNWADIGSRGSPT